MDGMADVEADCVLLSMFAPCPFALDVEGLFRRAFELEEARSR